MKKSKTKIILIFVSSLLVIGLVLYWESSQGDSEQEVLEYFFEIVLGAEYGDQAQVVRKWIDDIRIELHGQPNDDDRRCLNQVVGDLSSVISTLRISVSESDGDLDIYFIPESEFKSVLEQYVPVNFGFFWIWPNERYEIYKGTILISTTNITQKERCHIIREELTQSLGLLNDSLSYVDSIFYQRWTDTTQFSDIDKEVIKLMYSPHIRPGFSKADVMKVLAK